MELHHQATAALIVAVILRNLLTMECLTRRGTPDYDSTAFTRVGNIINAVRFRNGKVVEVAQFVIVPARPIRGI
jgi:hypothetical protein